MSYSNQPLSKRIFFSQESITVGQTDTVIAAALERFGLASAQLAEGYGKFEVAFDAESDRQTKFGIKVQATSATNELQGQIRSQFSADRRILRSVLPKDRAAYEPFGLNARIQDTREGLYSQAVFFYQTIKDDAAVLASLQERYNISPDVIDSRLLALEQFVESMRTLQLKTAEAQVATQRRREAMADLDKWMSIFIGIARQAFKDDPKQLEKLGVRVKVE